MLVSSERSPRSTSLLLADLFRDMGVRIVQLTWNSANLVGDSCEESRDVGLTAFGRAVVRELNRHRVLIDISHCDERTVSTRSTNPPLPWQ